MGGEVSFGGDSVPFILAGLKWAGLVAETESFEVAKQAAGNFYDAGWVADDSYIDAIDYKSVYVFTFARYEVSWDGKGTPRRVATATLILHKEQPRYKVVHKNILVQVFATWTDATEFVAGGNGYAIKPYLGRG